MLGCVYIEPERSRFHEDDIFDIFENNLATVQDTPVLLLGDSDSRTAHINDIITPEGFNLDRYNDNNV